MRVHIVERDAVHVKIAVQDHIEGMKHEVTQLKAQATRLRKKLGQNGEEHAQRLEAMALNIEGEAQHLIETVVPAFDVQLDLMASAADGSSSKGKGKGK